MSVHYLEIVTKDGDREIAILERAKGVRFGDPVPALGGARLAHAPDGGTIAVRAPMHDAEEVATRPYFLTDTIEETLDALVALGAVVAVPPMKIEGHGTIAVYFVDGLQYGLWQN